MKAHYEKMGWHIPRYDVCAFVRFGSPEASVSPESSVSPETSEGFDALLDIYDIWL